MNASGVLAVVGRRVKALPALLCAVLVGATLVGHGHGHGHGHSAGARHAQARPHAATLGAAGLLKAAYTGGATITMTVPTQANAVGYSGATLPLSGLALVSTGNVTPSSSGTGAGAGRVHTTFDLTRATDAYSLPLLRSVISERPLTGLSITIKNALASGQSAPETLRIDFPKAAYFGTQSVTATSSSAEHLTLLPLAYKFTYTPPNNGTPFTFGFDESTNTMS